MTDEEVVKSFDELAKKHETVRAGLQAEVRVWQERSGQYEAAHEQLSNRVDELEDALNKAGRLC